MRAATFIDVFCGAGGWTCGLKQAGFRHVVGVDSDEDAVASYKANHGAALLADVRTVNAATLAPFLGKRRLDLLVASPPCQSFSMAGTKRSKNVPADRLFQEVVRLATELKPRWVVMENVRGILTKGSVVRDMQVALRRAGYPYFEHRVLKAEQYGVPQLRHRVIFIAARKPNDIRFPAPTTEHAPPTLARVLQPASAVTDPVYWMTPAKADYYRRRQRERGFVRFVDPAKPAHTLRAGYFKSRGAEALVVQGSRMRLLTELECMRIQSFPDAYKLLGSRGAKYAQIGNAVPPRLARHVGAALKPATK